MRAGVGNRPPKEARKTDTASGLQGQQNGMNGGEHTNKLGYTIVEVMIFLAVSGFMFVLAAHFVNGKQAQAEFKQGTHDFQQQMQAVINDVSNGFYPSNSNLNCTASGSGSPTITGGTTEQGQNKGCVFLGKTIQFAPSDYDAAHFEVYTVAGRQYKDTSQILATTFVEAAPIAITSPDLTQDHLIQWGLKITKTIVSSTNPNCSSSGGGIGFFGSFGNYAVGSDLASGAQSIVVTCVPGSQLNTTTMSAFAGQIHSIVDADVMTNSQFVICLDDGNGHKASLAIGSRTGQQTTTDLETGTGIVAGCTS